MKVVFAKGSPLRTALYLVVLLGQIFPVLGRDIFVPGDAGTIQDGVNLAATGDTVWVKPGVYREFVILSGRAISLKAEGPQFSAIIEPPSDKAAITCMNGEGPATTISGFVLRRGALGANVLNASPTMVGNIVTNCSIGILAQGSGIFLTNEVTGCGVGFVLQQGNALVRGNSIFGCQKGIRVDSGDPMIRENFIHDNSVGGVEVLGAANSSLLQNVIYGNAQFAFAASTLGGTRGPILIHNTIVGPAGLPAAQTGGFPGGSVFVNNILVGVPAIRVDPGASPPRLMFNLVYSPSGTVTAGINLAAEDQNVIGDPKFAWASGGDFSLQAGSPAIDAGTLANTLDFDMAGEARARDGNGDGIARPDIGAYEFVPGQLRPPALFTASGYLDRIELSWQASVGATSYVISRSTNAGGPFEQIAETTGTTVLDKDVTPLITYFYSISAKNPNAQSKASTVIKGRAGNHAPASSANTVETLEDTPVVFALEVNIDEDGDPLFITGFADGSTGFVVTNSTEIVFSPPSEFAGAQSAQYIVSDGFGGSATNLLTVNVRAVDDPPFWQSPFSYALPANRASVIPSGAVDIDSSTVQLRITRAPVNGYVSVSGTNFVYRPARGFSGQDSFGAVAFDGAHQSSEAIFAVAIIASADVDNDRLPDDWENLWDVNNPAADPDGDGLTNLQEWIANTSPHDAESNLKISRVERTADGYLKISWPAVGGARYRIMSAEQISGFAGDFVALIQDVGLEMELAPDGTKVERSFIDTRPLTGNQRYYRVVAIAAPVGVIAPPPVFDGGGVVIINIPPGGELPVAEPVEQLQPVVIP